MNKIRVLHIGIKNWPYNSEFKEVSPKKRGGGANKYCHLLLNSFPDQVKNIIITQNSGNQSKKEIVGNNTIYRISSWRFGRKLSQLIFNISGFFVAYKLLKRNEANVIHGHMLIGILFSFLLKKRFNISVIGTPYSVYTTEFGFPLIQIARFLEKTIYSSLDFLVFESEENKKRAIEIVKNKFVNSKVILTGINAPHLKSEILSEKDYFKRKIKFIYVGRLVNIKALSRLLLGISKLENVIKLKIELNIIGEGEEYENLKSIIKNNSLENIVFLRGFVENIDGYLTSSDIFILPSFMEGLSIALLEGMSYGLACIVNDFGFPFADHVYVMKNNSPETIAQTLTSFVKNCDEINHYKKQSLKLIESEFSLKRFANQYADLYNLCIASKPYN